MNLWIAKRRIGAFDTDPANPPRPRHLTNVNRTHVMTYSFLEEVEPKPQPTSGELRQS
jgi:hypothetical protein